MRIVLVRHGATTASAGHCLGHTDVGLSDTGRWQVQSLADSWAASALPAPTRILSSDLRRARESAAPFALRFARPVETDVRLRELNFGEWDGRRWDDIERDDGDRLRAWTNVWESEPPPGGERVIDLCARAATVLDAAMGRARDDDSLLIVSHAGWIRAALIHLLGGSVGELFLRAMDHGRAWLLNVDPGGTRAVAENVAALTDVPSGRASPPETTRAPL